MLVVGQKEAEQRTVTIRDRLDAEHQQTLPITQAIELFQSEIRERRIRQVKAMPQTDTPGNDEAQAENAY
jgi:threonyl-tRNA synthetase